MKGIEYGVKETGYEDMGLFVIERRLRRSRHDSVVISCYYCLHGTIFQAPGLPSLVASRAARAAQHVTALIDNLYRLREQSYSKIALNADAKSAPQFLNKVKVDDAINFLSAEYSFDPTRM